MIQVTPLAGVKPRRIPPPRERFLSDEEIKAFWTAAGELGNPYGPALKLALLTGLRESNVAELRFDQVQGAWASFSADEMKGKRPFKCPMSKTAQAVVKNQPRITIVEGGKTIPALYAFTSSGTHPIANWPRAKARVHARMSELLEREVEEWHVHDLRHTLTTGLAKLGVPLEVRSRVTDHRVKGMNAQVYTHYDFSQEALDAVQKWAVHVHKLVAGLEVVKESATS